MKHQWYQMILSEKSLSHLTSTLPPEAISINFDVFLENTFVYDIYLNINES